MSAQSPRIAGLGQDDHKVAAAPRPVKKRARLINTHTLQWGVGPNDRFVTCETLPTVGEVTCGNAPRDLGQLIHRGNESKIGRWRCQRGQSSAAITDHANQALSGLYRNSWFLAGSSIDALLT